MIAISVKKLHDGSYLEPYAVAMVTGDDAMWSCFGSLMIELVTVTKKL